MNGKRLVDTNIIVAVLGQDPSLEGRFREPWNILIPSTVLGELYFGVEKSLQRESNRQRLEELAAAHSVLGTDARTAEIYGGIKNQLRKKGRPIPENDIWIAATALQHELTLVTRDRHFQEVEGLPTERW